MSYVFSRSTDSVRPDYAAIAQSGATIALNSEDPHLAQAIADARQNGAKVAIWIPAHQGQDPTAYGDGMARIAQYYHPDAILPNLEGAQAKASSGGSEWSNAMMASFQRYMPQGSIKLDVVTEPGETDFDYKPFLNYGGGVVNEAFTGDMTHVNPDVIRQKLRNAGVPDSKINILLAPGQDPGAMGGNFSAYTWDDMTPEQQTNFLQQYSAYSGGGKKPGTPGTTPTTPTGPNQTSWTRYGPRPGAKLGAGPQTAEPTPTSTGPAATNPQIPQIPGKLTSGGYSQVPDMTPRWQQLDDAHNPQAQAYSRARLSQHGITVKKGEDAAAMWRAYSKTLADARNTALAAGPDDPGQGVIALGKASKLPAGRTNVVGVATPIQPAVGQTTQVDPGQIDRTSAGLAAAARQQAAQTWVRYGRGAVAR